jgi:DNA-binding MarR family transcriptional regulator
MASPTSDDLGPPLIGALLRIPVDLVHERMLAGLHARGFDDLVAAHLVVLQYPGPDGRRPSELAAHARMTKQALNYLLGQLEARGYLERRDEPDAPRSRRVHLTRRGRRAMSAIREIVGEVEREWSQELGGESFERLKELLVRLNAVATGVNPPRRAPGGRSAPGSPPRAS